MTDPRIPPNIKQPDPLGWQPGQPAIDLWGFESPAQARNFIDAPRFHRASESEAMKLWRSAADARVALWVQVLELPRLWTEGCGPPLALGIFETPFLARRHVQEWLIAQPERLLVWSVAALVQIEAWEERSRPPPQKPRPPETPAMQWRLFELENWLQANDVALRVVMCKPGEGGKANWGKANWFVALRGPSVDAETYGDTALTALCAAVDEVNRCE